MKQVHSNRHEEADYEELMQVKDELLFSLSFSFTWSEVISSASLLSRKKQVLVLGWKLGYGMIREWGRNLQ